MDIPEMEDTESAISKFLKDKLSLDDYVKAMALIDKEMSEVIEDAEERG